MGEAVTFSVSDFVASLNQTLDVAYGAVYVTGEVANYRLSRNQWIYFSLKDDTATVKCFASRYSVNTPLEDGMKITVLANPRLHPLYDFSLNIQSVKLVGEGTIKKAAQITEAKLRAEGLFDQDRKRNIPYPPNNIALITSGESAAYRDFVKILDGRWCGVNVTLIDVLVQGDGAPRQLVRAIEQAQMLNDMPDLVVITRGGGSADDLQAFNDESVVRAVSTCRVPVVAAIGHEVDTCLVELAADLRASTPSNAAELISPDKSHVKSYLNRERQNMFRLLEQSLANAYDSLCQNRRSVSDNIIRVIDNASRLLGQKALLLDSLNPDLVLQRGYAIVRKGMHQISSDGLAANDLISVETAKHTIQARVVSIESKRRISDGPRPKI